LAAVAVPASENQNNTGTGARRRKRGNQPARRPNYAALDLGTNNCRLLIARPARDGFQVIDGFSRIVRLGEGMGETGMLSEAAMGRAVEALKICADKLVRRRVRHVRCVATEACRAARNCDIFLQRVAAETGLTLDIISSREEAELTLAGCLPLLDPAVEYALVFDVGGGSAEFVWLKLERGGAPIILGWVSLPSGVVTLTERHGSNDFSPVTYERTVREIEDLLHPFEREHRIRGRIFSGAAQMLGTAGTVTTIAAVNMDLPRYSRAQVDGSVLDFAAVHRIGRSLARSSYAERAANPCIGTARADLVVAGCAVLEAVCRTWLVGRLRVADRGVREGILLDMMAADGAGGADAIGTAAE
jgi:exopolyphosphatase / guanosine-5'-triphosphate,3'-diphosphate pyrophosphatase